MHEGGRPHEAVVEWFDSHCHIQDEFAEAGDGRTGPDGHPGETHATRLAGTVARASQAGVTRMVCVGTDAGTSAEAVRLAESLRAEGSVGAAEGVELWATVGLHPHDASHGVDSLDTLIEHLPTSGVVVGIGECGLDYHYDHSPRPAQREAFAQQIELATRLDLALVVHTREAWPDTFDILAATGVPERTIIHCFTGGPEEARRCLDLGAVLSFSGVVTFTNAGPVREAAALCPLDRLLVETDSPFLAPVPHRGTLNEPSRVPLIGAAIAQVKQVETSAVAAASTRNALAAFAL